MKFPVNTEKIVLLGLLFFYGFIIIRYFISSVYEGMDGPSVALENSTTSKSTTTSTPAGEETAPKSSGTNQDRIDELNKKIDKLRTQIFDHEKEISNIKKLTEVTSPENKASATP